MFKCPARLLLQPGGVLSQPGGVLSGGEAVPEKIPLEKSYCQTGLRLKSKAADQESNCLSARGEFVEHQAVGEYQTRLKQGGFVSCSPETASTR
jgi:hypothetical protein